jgi:hypothetical protein
LGRPRISLRPPLPHRSHLPAHADGKIPPHRRTSAPHSPFTVAGPTGKSNRGGAGFLGGAVDEICGSPSDIGSAPPTSPALYCVSRFPPAAARGAALAFPSARRFLCNVYRFPSARALAPMTLRLCSRLHRVTASNRQSLIQRRGRTRCWSFQLPRRLLTCVGFHIQGRRLSQNGLLPCSP